METVSFTRQLSVAENVDVLVVGRPRRYRCRCLCGPQWGPDPCV